MELGPRRSFNLPDTAKNRPNASFAAHPRPPNPRLCPRHKSIVYKGCTLGVRGVRTGCTMSKSVGIRRASGVHPLYTVLRAHEYGLAGQQMEGLVAPAPF